MILRIFKGVNFYSGFSAFGGGKSPALQYIKSPNKILPFWDLLSYDEENNEGVV